MKSNVQFLLSAIILILILGVGCKKMDDAYRQFIEKGETVYIAKADSIRVHGGDQRIELSWLLLSDPKVRSYKVYWDNRKDSIEGVVQKTSDVDTVRLMLNNMEEGIHYFEIYMYDKDGNSSVDAEASGSAYGSIYQESLLIRTFINMRKIDNDIEIEWTSAGTDLIYSEIRYLNNQGDSTVHIVPATRELDTLKGMSLNNEFIYRSAFLPDSPSLDTFYTSYKMVDYGEYAKEKGMFLSFSTSVNYGTQKDQLNILLSTDFDGIYEIGNIHNATWVDITDDFPLAKSKSYEDWGPEDMIPFLSKGKSIYIAFRYTTLPQEENGSQRTWKIKNFELKNRDGMIMADHVKADFTLVTDGPVESGRVSVSSSTIILRGSKVSKESRTETWAISKPINP